jgi:hypothetical protein
VFDCRAADAHWGGRAAAAGKDLSGFDFAASEINEATVRTLHRCEFMDEAQNVVLIGGPGTGKTHVATALGIQAIEHHRRKARFFSTIELVNALEQEKAKGKAGQIAEGLTKLDLVILSVVEWSGTAAVILEPRSLARQVRVMLLDGDGSSCCFG